MKNSAEKFLMVVEIDCKCGDYFYIGIKDFNEVYQFQCKKCKEEYFYFNCPRCEVGYYREANSSLINKIEGKWFCEEDKEWIKYDTALNIKTYTEAEADKLEISEDIDDSKLLKKEDDYNHPPTPMTPRNLFITNTIRFLLLFFLCLLFARIAYVEILKLFE